MPPLERDRRPLLLSLFVCLLLDLLPHRIIRCQCVYCVPVSRSFGQYHRCARVTRLCPSHCQHRHTRETCNPVELWSCLCALLSKNVSGRWGMGIFLWTCQDTGFAPASKRYVSQTVFTSFLLCWLWRLFHTFCCLNIHLLAHSVSILVVYPVFVHIFFVSLFFNPDWIDLRCSLCFKKLCSQVIQSPLSAYLVLVVHLVL